MRCALLGIAMTGCGHAAAPVPVVENQLVPRAPCEIAIAGEAVVANGHPLPDFTLSRLRAALGEPDRIERVTHRERYEEFGDDVVPPTSDMVAITDTHYVYDDDGVVFASANGAFGSDATPTILRVFFAHPRQFDSTEPPAVLPRVRGRCAVSINGHRLDPDADLRPTSATYQTDHAAMFGMDVGFASIATEIDQIYAESGALTIYLDAPATGRAAYVEIR